MCSELLVSVVEHTSWCAYCSNSILISSKCCMWLLFHSLIGLKLHASFSDLSACLFAWSWIYWVDYLYYCKLLIFSMLLLMFTMMSLIFSIWYKLEILLLIGSRDTVLLYSRESKCKCIKHVINGTILDDPKITIQLSFLMFSQTCRML